MPTRTYTNFYHVLGLETPDRCRMPHAPAGAVPTALSDNDVKTAYRRAMLRAHPDKHNSRHGSQTSKSKPRHGHGHDTRSQSQSQGQNHNQSRKEGHGSNSGYTVDDVKEAYQTLGNAAMRTQYDRWLAHQFTNGAFKHLDAEGEEVSRRVEAQSEDFVAGLEGLDLSDFEVVGRMEIDGEEDGGEDGAEGEDEGDGDEEAEDEAEGKDEDESSWKRDCRCGGEFTIKESQLEKAADRGESEVVVGCKNCSLWVRVAFGVEGD